MVKDIDFAAMMEEMEGFFDQLEAPNEAYATSLEGTNCENINVDIEDEAAREQMLAIAKAEAPGTVGYLTFVFHFAGVSSGGENVSGDCETDIASIQALVDAGKPMSQMTGTEFVQVTSLLAAIQAECTPERMTDFFDNQDVQDFMGG